MARGWVEGWHREAWLELLSASISLPVFESLI